MSSNMFGEPEFFSTNQIKDYCGNVRNKLRPLYHELHVSAEEMEAVLKYVPSANPHGFGLDSKLRAKLVAQHMRRSADAIETAVGSAVKSYVAFRKHYSPELSAAGNNRKRRREFRFDQ